MGYSPSIIMLQSKTPTVVWLVAALQFIYILDFIVVMPLGPDLASALGFTVNQMGWVSASYTAAAILANVISLYYLDRLPHKRTLLILWLLFTCATWLCSLAENLQSLLWLRALAGLFGAPALAIGIAVVLEQTEPSQRGKVMGTVMSGFTLAAVLGIPASLWLSDHAGWSRVFHVIGAIALVLLCCIHILIEDNHPAQKTSEHAESATTIRTLLQNPRVSKMFGVQALNQGSVFMLIPIFSAFQVSNLGVPRADLNLYYLLGGIAAFLMIQFCARFIDRHGLTLSLYITTAILIMGFYPLWHNHNVMTLLFFIAFMAGNAGRNITLATSSSHIPAPHQRARYFALQNIVQDSAIISGSLIASQILTSVPNGTIQKMPIVATLALSGVLLTVLLHTLWFKEKH